MQTRVAVISIILEDPDSVAPMNDILHAYGDYIIGRMGVPHRARGINLISIAIDAPEQTITALSQKVSSLPGVSATIAYSKVETR